MQSIEKTYGAIQNTVLGKAQQIWKRHELEIKRHQSALKVRTQMHEQCRITQQVYTKLQTCVVIVGSHGSMCSILIPLLLFMLAVHLVCTFELFVYFVCIGCALIFCWVSNSYFSLICRMFSNKTALRFCCMCGLFFF